MREQELQIIKQAIINELEGYEFYRMAVSHADDQEVKESFKVLAAEEQKHIEWLNDLFDKIKTDPEDGFKLAAMENPPSPGLYKWENLDRTQAGVAVSVFGIGMQMEKASIAFYLDAAEKTSFESAKSLYLTLAKWEEVHLATFAKAYDKYQEQWWDDQGYAPF